MKLTERTINTLTCAPGKKDRLVSDDEQQGLYIRVTGSGGKTYLAQYTIGGKKSRVPLGSCSAISLRAARTACATIMGARAFGFDTGVVLKQTAAAARAKAARERLTVGALIGDWQALHLASKRPRYAAEAVRALRYALDQHWNSPAEDLDHRTIVKMLDGIQRADRHAMASRTAAYGKACFQWALRRGMIASNPFATLPPIGTRPKRERVLTDSELARVWRAAEAMRGSFGRIVQLLILTGQRREEVGGMAWDELSEDLSAWTIAEHRTKNGRPHLVPLAEPARSIVRACLHVDELVMPGDRPGSPFSGWSKAKMRLDAASGVTNWRLHDLRRSMATGFQKLGVRLETTEAVLNHVGSRAGIVGIYQRHDFAAEKRAALDLWAQHVIRTVDADCRETEVGKTRRKPLRNSRTEVTDRVRGP